MLNGATYARARSSFVRPRRCRGPDSWQASWPSARWRERLRYLFGRDTYLAVFGGASHATCFIFAPSKDDDSVQDLNVRNMRAVVEEALKKQAQSSQKGRLKTQTFALSAYALDTAVAPRVTTSDDWEYLAAREAMLFANNGDKVPLNTRRETSSYWRKGKFRAKHSKNTWTRCTSIVGWGMFT